MSTLINFAHRLVRRTYLRLGFKGLTLPVQYGTIHYFENERTSSRPTLVLLHGIGTSSSTWINVLPHLAPRYHVIALDLLGFGFSKVEGERSYLHVAEHRDATKELLTRKGVEKCTLIGHSFGGWIAAALATRTPQRIEHLVLVNTAGIYYQGVESLRALFTLRTTRDVNRLFTQMWYRYPWYYRLFSPSILADMKERCVGKIIAAVEKKDFLGQELSSLRMPVSVIWGAEDRLILQDSLVVLKHAVPHLKVCFIQKCGHVPQLERYAEFSTILLKLLEGKTDVVD